MHIVLFQGFPIPVSFEIIDHFLSDHAQPSFMPFTFDLYSLPSPASVKGSTKSGFKYNNGLVSISSA
jgi:hypothetical protein